MEIIEFTADCLKGKCNRHTLTSNQCQKVYKIVKCFNKYNFSIEKNKRKNEKNILDNIEKNKKKKENKIIDSMERWESKKQQFQDGLITKEDLFDVDKKLLEVFREVDKRDNGCCVFWNYIMTVEQKVYIYNHFYRDFQILSKTIDHAHIDAISEKPGLKYDKDNIICLSRFFHSRFDQYKNLLLGCSVSKEERQKYVEIFKKYIEEKNVGI